MRWRGPIFFLLVTAGISAASAEPLGSPLDDASLALQRGGFELPNGLDVNLAVVTDETVDGQLVLRTIYRVEGNSASTTVLSGNGAGGLAPVGVTAAGNVTLSQIPGGSRVQYSADGTNITTLVGNALSTTVDNSADGRSIDVQTNVDLRLSGATPQNLGSALSRINDLALTSATLFSR